MKRLALLAASVAALILFTACPDNKPTDEPVVIPDGTYRETAHYIVSRNLEDGSIIQEADTVFATTLIISSGEFIYEDMCSDKEPNVNYTNYSPHFIYFSNYYCPIYVYDNVDWILYSNPICKTPNITPDGFFVIQRPCFINGPMDIVDTNYIYRTPVKKNGDTYMFEQKHSFPCYNNTQHNYSISHTLTPLSNQ